MITDNTSLILFRLITFASLPIIAGVFALAMLRRPVDRDTLQPLFYAQCFVTTPVVLAANIAETLTRLPQPAANVPATLLFAAAAAFYIGVEAAWFARESKRSLAAGLAWARGDVCDLLLIVAERCCYSAACEFGALSAPPQHARRLTLPSWSSICPTEAIEPRLICQPRRARPARPACWTRGATTNHRSC